MNINLSFAESACIKQVEIDDKNKLYSHENLYNFDHCITEQELTGFLCYQQQQLNKAGYVTSNLELIKKSNDKLVFGVKEGKLSEVKGQKGFLLKDGRVFNLNDIDQAIEQANKLSTIDTKIDIKKSDNGDTTAIIKQERLKPFSVSYLFDNENYKHNPQHSVVFDIENKLGYYEKLNLNFTNIKGTKSRAASLTIPYYYWTIKLKYYDSTSKSINPNLQTSWQYGLNQGIAVERIVYRDNKQVTSLGIDLTVKRPTNYTQYKRLLTYPTNVLKLYSSYRKNEDWYNNNLQISFSKGLKGLGSSNDRKSSSYPYIQRAQFAKLEIEDNFATILFNKPYNITLRLQNAYNYLLPQDKFAITDGQSVRGYIADSIKTDSGILIKQEYTLMTIRQDANRIMPFIFADAAVGKNIKSKINQYASSIGTGINARFKDTSVSLTYSVPFRDNIYPERNSKPSLFLNFKYNIN